MTAVRPPRPTSPSTSRSATPRHETQPSPDEVQAVLELVPVMVGVAVAAQEAADVTITLPQYRALFVLHHYGPCSARGLAERLRVHTSSVTRVCDRLVAAGHMTREQNEDNRREVVLTVTPQGEQVVRRVLAARQREVRRILAAVRPATRKSLVRASGELVAAEQDSRQSGDDRVG